MGCPCCHNKNRKNSEWIKTEDDKKLPINDQRSAWQKFIDSKGKK